MSRIFDKIIDGVNISDCPCARLTETSITCTLDYAFGKMHINELCNGKSCAYKKWKYAEEEVTFYKNKYYTLYTKLQDLCLDKASLPYQVNYRTSRMHTGINPDRVPPESAAPVFSTIQSIEEIFGPSKKK